MDNPAVSPELLVTLTAALENLRTACRLPSGWKAVPSLRLTEKGASLLVVWRPTPASVAPRTKNKRRSPSSRQRSADRAAAHKTRKGQQSAPPQQQLRRSAPVFNMPIPPTPNSVLPAARFPAAEESERAEGRMEAAQSRAGKERGPGAEQSSQPGPTSVREQRKRERSDIDCCTLMLVEFWERGETRGKEFVSVYKTLDSLAGEGTARKLLMECDALARGI